MTPEAPRPVTQVTLLEEMTSTEALVPGAVAVLSRSSQVPAAGYQLDVLVRRAAERDVSALVLRRSTRRSLTAESLARRGHVALLDVQDDADPLQVLDRLAATVSGDTRAALARLAAATEYEPDPAADVETILRTLSRLSAVPLELSAETDVRGSVGTGTEIDVDGRIQGSVRSSQAGDPATLAATLAAATLSRVLTARERDTLRPIRSASGALSQLLLCAPANLAPVSERALDVGVPVNGWHCAVRLAPDAADTTGDESILTRFEDDLVALIARRPRDPRSSWMVARPDSSFVLVRTTRADPGRDSDDTVRHTVDELLADLLVRYPSTRIRVGVATPHEGASGLRASAEEARTALAAARLSEDPVSIATFDSLGLRRMLAEWLVTDTARDTVSDLLAPLDALGPQKATLLIDTLHAYLDERGSLKRAATRLNLHRNAVVYRMAQIATVLPTDLNDPDERFALQLACRARLMTVGRG
ncbi:MAG TPA: helix-turn-helix domain-containing protein [Nocardioides sp.]|uniref:PucR family transcriptional regulator n=1 Tax=Nocardioides sp. TaxID=35761 RepID=UPI002E2FE4AA|nr:helix-turn-helix domain-containing protein [Nocardioides sp.]HEX3930021.1 helix-turn-helix domain-containing protein [Nocardioides sp.]